ncbi:MAG: hypothetical protein ABII00_11160 [Elusimicrobiota bacterium]
MSSLLCLCLLLSSPGPLATQAFANIITHSGKVSAGVQVAPILPTVSPVNSAQNLSAPALSISLKSSLPTTALPTPIAKSPAALRSGAVAAAARSVFPAAKTAARAAETPAALSIPGSQARTPISDKAARSASGYGAPESARAPPAARQSLETGARNIQQAATHSGRFSSLQALFTGSRRSGAQAVPAGQSGIRSLLGRISRPLSLRRAANPAAPERRAEQGARQPPAPPSRTEKDDELSPEARRGILAMFAARFPSMLAYSISAISYPLILIEAVGKGGMYQLFSLGGLLSIGLALVAGRVADRMPLKKYIVFNTALRAVLSFATAGLYAAGLLNFGTLMGLTILNGWQFTTLFITDPAMMTELVGDNQAKIRSTEALLRIATIFVTVLSGLFLGKYVVDAMGFAPTFVIVGILYAIPVWILGKFLPDIKRKLVRKAGQVADKLKKLPWKKIALNTALLAGAIGIYAFVWQSPFPFIAAVLFMLWRSAIFQNVIKKHGLLKLALVFVMLTAIAEIPMRNAVLGALAEETVGQAGKAAFFGNLLASFYMGQLVTGTGMLSPSMEINISKIGPWKLKSPIRFNLKTTLKWVGAAGLAAWSYFYVIPKGWLASAAASVGFTALSPALLTVIGGIAAAAAVLKLYTSVHNAVPKVSPRAWMRWEIVGLLGMSIPLFFWGSPAALYLSLFLFGMLHNATARTISATYASQAKKHASDSFQYMMGIKSSFVNMATSIAYAIYGLAKTLPEKIWGDPNAFPFTWYVVVGIYAIFAVVFFAGSRHMPGRDKKEAVKSSADQARRA